MTNGQSSPVVPKLPHELMDRIIDLCDLRSTLYSCSLVCRAWVPRSQFHLFKVMLIGSLREFKSIVRAAETPHLRPLFAVTSSLDITGYSDYANQRKWIQTMALRLGEPFSGVTSLSMSGIDWGSPTLPPNVLATGFASFTGTVKMVLSDCKFSTFGVFRRIISAFPNLRELHLYHLKIRSNPSPQFLEAVAGSPRPRLESLTTIDVCYALYDWLSVTPSIRALHRLELNTATDQMESEASQRMISLVGEHLKDLRVKLTNENQVKSFCSSLCLTKCADLEILHLILPTGIDTLDIHSYLAALLSQISPSSRLQHLVFSTRLNLEGDTIDYYRLGPVDKLLSHSHFRNLCLVCAEVLVKFNLPLGVTELHLQQGVENALSDLVNRNVTVRCLVFPEYEDQSSEDEGNVLEDNASRTIAMPDDVERDGQEGGEI
ncbi:hypothetical protein SCP_1600050 [Sparassis crispa]|uniref:F-box domain-containing protein n=1 Tax=Sparassis crispa TaxID=139825 RepID=A0A401H4J9_9APHY|nr:hypothetical protein SCP_1600050 [Sparassis crispa]GBE89344.1 hypothetical protein SCP_1600050 [Sparassis crispa]